MARYFAISLLAICFCALLFKLAVDQCVSHRGDRWSDIPAPVPGSMCTAIHDADEQAWAEKMAAQKLMQGGSAQPVSYGMKGSIDLLFSRPTRFFAELNQLLFFFVLMVAMSMVALVIGFIWKAIVDVVLMVEAAKNPPDDDRPTVMNPERRGPRRDTASIKLIRSEHDPRHRPKE